MVLVSAVFFSGKWATPFTEVRPGVTFKKGDGETVKLPFILESERFIAGRRPKKKLKWVELPYQVNTIPSSYLHNLILRTYISHFGVLLVYNVNFLDKSYEVKFKKMK